MNWLAHLLVAAPTAESRLGHILADAAHRRHHATLAPGIRAGIAEHVAVDRFTDAHPAVVATTARIVAPYRRFAGVLTDVFYGHALALAWPRFAAVTLGEFTADAYATMLAYDGELPVGARPMLQRFAREDWLGAYTTYEGTAGLLAMMARRLSVRFDREVELAGAMEQFAEHRGEITDEFDAFFPDLLNYARTFKR